MIGQMDKKQEKFSNFLYQLYESCVIIIYITTYSYIYTL